MTKIPLLHVYVYLREVSRINVKVLALFRESYAFIHESFAFIRFI